MNTSFERDKMKEDWLTPPRIIKALGDFDLDPCASVNQPWRTATTQYTVDDDGLSKEWHGRVWCNPPYGNKAADFMKRMKSHGNGIALIFARTETKNWFDNIWDGADAVLFIRGRLKFYTLDGVEGNSAGAPSALIAYGKENADVLERFNFGKFVRLR
jgi:phage N-6-adenine-methyltransferase